MNKSTFFTGQPVFTQLVKLLPKSIIDKAVAAHKADHYCKKFDTYHHLITMLYACFQHCTSLREVSTGMQACEGRLQSLGIKHLTARSTFSEANKRRKFEVFEEIYSGLYKNYQQILPDSRSGCIDKNIVIVDSTTISLFKEILKGSGTKTGSGKSKGGVKVHMAVRAHEDVPYFVDLTKGTSADLLFLRKLEVPANAVLLMDRGYNDYRKFFEYSATNISWVTRRRKDSHITFLNENMITDEQKQSGVISDETILLGAKNSAIQQVPSRLVTYYDEENDRTLEFITNNKEWEPLKVASLYKRRWQIEVLFKRLKQNMPLQYFLGDNENAIKIQIYCALIADLLLKIATQGLKRKWAFSNISSLVRLHLMHYTDLKRFLENPEKAKTVNPLPMNNSPQLSLYYR